MIWDVIVKEMLSGNFSFLILLVGVIQTILMLITLTKK